jgi:hypothetical protein
MLLRDNSSASGFPISVTLARLNAISSSICLNNLFLKLSDCLRWEPAAASIAFNFDHSF